jgi:hypothetical protein
MTRRVMTDEERQCGQGLFEVEGREDGEEGRAQGCAGSGTIRRCVGDAVRRQGYTLDTLCGLGYCPVGELFR